MAEIISKRTYNSKTFDNGDGTFTLRVHIGHIHYKDDAGAFQDSDFTFVDQGTYWSMTKHNYKLYVAKDFGAAQLIRFDNKYEGANHTIYYEPTALYWVNADNRTQRTKIADAQTVTGVVSGNTIRWTNAFGTGIHYEVTLRRHGFSKELVVDTLASLGTPPYINYFLASVAKWTASDLTVKADNQTVWDENSLYEHDGWFDISETSGKKSYILPAYGYDSATPEENRVSLKVFYEKRAGALWQGKLITKAMLNNAVFPIRADTITNYAPSAGDGEVLSYETSTTWNTAHNALNGTSVDYTSANGRVTVGWSASGFFTLRRSFFPISVDIPAAATITAAVLYVYFYSVANNDNDGDDYLAVVGETSQADFTQLAVADYDQCGAVHTPTEGSDDHRDITSINTSAYTTFTLNSTGRGWIPIGSAGYCKLGIREGHDILDHEYAGAYNTQNSARFYTSEDTGTSDPYLEVDYSPGSSSSSSCCWSSSSSSCCWSSSSSSCCWSSSSSSCCWSSSSSSCCWSCSSSSCYWSSSSCSSCFSMAIGTWCWGHDTDVEEQNIGNLVDGSGTGVVFLAGDDEYLKLYGGEEWILPSKNVGSVQIVISLNKYKPGTLIPTISYRTGPTRIECEGAEWILYTVPFVASGWVQTKLSVI